MTDRQAITGFLLCGASLVLLFCPSTLLSPRGRAVLLQEGGVVESASAAGYFVCAGLILGRCNWSFLRQRHAYPILAVLLGLRELDFDKKLTTEGIFTTSFYLSPEISWVEKSFGVAVILLLAYLISSIVVQDLKLYFTRFRMTSAVSIGVPVILALMAIAKLLDGLPRKLERFGRSVERETSIYLLAAEEVFEMGIPVILILTFSVAMRQDAAIVPSP